MNQRTRQIGADERSGVLSPVNLARFSAQWLSPAPEVGDVVDTYWAVDWDFRPGEEVTQRIIDFPAITFSVEQGNVPAPLVVTTVRPKAWSRVISGQGSVFAIRLRPAGLAVISDIHPAVLEIVQELTRELDERAHGLLRSIAGAPTAEKRARRADRLIAEQLSQRPPTRSHLLANAAVGALTSRPQVRTGRSVAAQLGTSERTLQRALRSTTGLSPNTVARRIRLQEVVRQLSSPDADIASIVAEMGYVDQAHLINEFRTVSSLTPGQYVRELQASHATLIGLKDPSTSRTKPSM